jgi:hypothetical protein
VVRGVVQDEEGMGRARREPWLGKPRGDMLPVHGPVLIPWPFRGLTDQRGPWDPAGDRHGLDPTQTWPLARWCVDPRPICFKIPGTRPGMVRVHAGLIAGPCRPLPAALGGAVRSGLTQGASSGEDNIGAFVQGRTSSAGARRNAPSLQRAPQGDGGDSGLRSLDERGPQLPHTDTVARSMLGPSIRPHDGGEMHGRTTRGVPTRLRSLGLEGVPRVTIRGPQALDRAGAHLQALGCAPGGVPGRYCLLGLPFLITRECEVQDPLWHGWRKVFPLKRHR